MDRDDGSITSPLAITADDIANAIRRTAKVVQVPLKVDGLVLSGLSPPPNSARNQPMSASPLNLREPTGDKEPPVRSW